jgi:spore coat protein U-like protein
MNHRQVMTLRVKLWLRCLLAGGVALLANAASAQVASCTVNYAGSSLNFGPYNAFNASPVTATMSATVNCTHVSGGQVTVAWTMSLSNGGSGSCATRRMTSGGDTLYYNVYQNSLAGGIWGTGCAGNPSGSFKVTNGSPNGSAGNVLYGQLPTGQFNAGVGSYSDNLVLTVTYN